jgi:hypothetical protein
VVITNCIINPTRAQTTLHPPQLLGGSPASIWPRPARARR